MINIEEIIAESTKNIKKEYFLITNAFSRVVYRERVYCYELYHQMRLQLQDKFDVLINGELDKVGYNTLRENGVKYYKPDFLIHRPGDGHLNESIIEVKNSFAQSREIKKDLTKMAVFIELLNYKKGIYLIYGENSRATAKRIDKAIKENFSNLNISIFVHENPSMCAEIYTNNSSVV